MTINSTTIEDADTVQVDLYHCASMHGTHEQQRKTIARLEWLADAGLVDGVNRHAWAHTLTPDADDDWCEEARATYARFWAWANANGRTLEPAFGTRTVRPMVSEDSYEVIDFPVLAVAVYADDELVMVAPSTDASTDGTYTVSDCLEDLERTAEPKQARAAT